MLRVYNTVTNKNYGDIMTDCGCDRHNITIAQAMQIVGLEMSQNNIYDENDNSYTDKDGEEFFYDEIAIKTITRGGYRPNAGAKKTLPAGAKRRALAMTDAEYAEVKKLIAKLRK